MTLTSSSLIHPSGDFPAPEILAFWTRPVHMTMNPLEVLPQELPDLFPALDGLLLPIHRLVIVEEAVPSLRVHMKLVGLPELLERLLVQGDQLGCGELVLLAEYA